MVDWPANGSNVDTWDAILKSWLDQYIDQDVRTSASPTFVSLALSTDNAPLNQILIENKSSTSAKYPGFGVYNFVGGYTGYPYCGMYSAAGTKDSPSIYAAGVSIGAYIWAAHNGTSFVETARFAAMTASNWDATHKDSYFAWYLASGVGSITEKLRLTTTGFGVGTTAPDKQVEINSVDGSCLRLTYNDANGTATYYMDCLVSAAGNGTLTPSGGVLSLTGSFYPATDDTYYLGKNDDDTPFAWKGVILKDTTNGKYYRVEVISGVVTATDLTD